MFLRVFDKKTQVTPLPDKNLYPLKKDNILKRVVLFVATGGLYGLVWAVQLDDMSATAQESRKRTEYASLTNAFAWFMSFGFYGVLWSFMLGLKINIGRYYRDMSETSLGALPFVLALLYIPTLGLAPLIAGQYYINQMCDNDNDNKNNKK